MTTRYFDRRAALRVLLDATGVDALLVTSLINVRYLTGFTGSNAALLVDTTSDEGTRFCTDFRYLTQSAAEVPDLQRVIERPCGPALLRDATGRIGFEPHVVTVDGLAELRAAGQAELTGVGGLVEQLRTVKDATEIDALRRACAIADRALADMLEAGSIRAGQSERDIQLDLDHRMRLLGADDISFSTIVAAGAHSAIPHHSPTDAVVARGDLVKLDFGATVDGYHSDMTRTFVVGSPAPWQSELYQAVAEAQAAGRDACRPGATGAEVDGAARAVIHGAGFADYYDHGLGHGVGLVIHEDPFLTDTSAAIMEADMCVTVEPGVYLPGRGGVRIEDSGVIGPDGYEILTLTTKALLEL